MMNFLLNPEISVGDILTTFSILLSVLVLISSWNKDQKLKQKDYADKIRHSASVVVAKIERWKGLSLQFFDEIQPTIVDADMNWVSKKDILNVRDIFWRELVATRTKIFQKIADEEIEIAYTNLYGYDPKIQGLFDDVVRRLRAAENYTHQKTLYQTQIDIISAYERKSVKLQRSALGNKLRDTCYEIKKERQEMMTQVIKPFVDQLIRLIQENDRNILNKHLHVENTQNVYTLSASEFEKGLNKKIIKELKSFQKAKEYGEFKEEIVKLLMETQLCAIDRMHEPFMAVDPNKLLDSPTPADEAK